MQHQQALHYNERSSGITSLRVLSGITTKDHQALLHYERLSGIILLCNISRHCITTNDHQALLHYQILSGITTKDHQALLHYEVLSGITIKDHQALLHYERSSGITSLRKIISHYFTMQHQQVLLYYK
jgi:hypothetical protein